MNSSVTHTRWKLLMMSSMKLKERSVIDMSCVLVVSPIAVVLVWLGVRSYVHVYVTCISVWNSCAVLCVCMCVCVWCVIIHLCLSSCSWSQKRQKWVMRWLEATPVLREEVMKEGRMWPSLAVILSLPTDYKKHHMTRLVSRITLRYAGSSIMYMWAQCYYGLGHLLQT